MGGKYGFIEKCMKNVWIQAFRGYTVFPRKGLKLKVKHHIELNTNNSLNQFHTLLQHCLHKKYVTFKISTL